MSTVKEVFGREDNDKPKQNYKSLKEIKSNMGRLYSQGKDVHTVGKKVYQIFYSPNAGHYIQQINKTTKDRK